MELCIVSGWNSKSGLQPRGFPRAIILYLAFPYSNAQRETPEIYHRFAYAGINLTGYHPPGTPGLLQRNVCPALRLLHNSKCPGAGPINDDVPGAKPINDDVPGAEPINDDVPGAEPINDDVPGAEHFYQLAFKHENRQQLSGLKIKMSECPIGPDKVQKTHNAISNCLFALGP